MKICIDAEIREGWVVCPLCGKKQFKIQPETEIHNLEYRCKTSNGRSEHFIRVTKEREDR